MSRMRLRLRRDTLIFSLDRAQTSIFKLIFVGLIESKNKQRKRLTSQLKRLECAALDGGDDLKKQFLLAQIKTKTLLRNKLTRNV